ncbi:GNAT family N-acetyltransferase [Levilactobacillus bambusae]|uniref:Acetyltransferase n=1 Tax=Levilactobacillus bambusae TaxID=2024736 RepID=A0A2V1MYW8_9LACO|nr:N-acetyltransferase [Levilactobacillus bambusae]PWF99364.1 acetyltransferase [Levilactobacillus bambusae]
MTIIEDHNRDYITTETGDLAAEITYIPLSDRVWVIEHTFVRPGQSLDLSDRLINHLVLQANQHHIQLKVLDPYTKRFLAKHPESPVDLWSPAALTKSGKEGVSK